MSITILYFARVKEALDTDKESFDLDENTSTVEHLVAQLSQRGNIWQSTLAEKNILVAVNQTVANFATKLNDGDEIAFYPPVTGG